MLFAVITLHVVSATVWTGGHLVLATTILPRALRAGDAEAVLAFEQGYERLGLPALLIQVVTGFWLAFHHLPNPADWLSPSDDTSALVLAKIVLLALTMGLAIHARTRILPDLDAARLRALAWHIVPVTVLSVLFVVVGVGLRLVTA